jgi:hypothetical protein
MRANDIDSTAKTGYTLTCLMETLYFLWSGASEAAVCILDEGVGEAGARHIAKHLLMVIFERSSS